MLHSPLVKRIIALLLSLSLAGGYSPVFAGIVTTEQLLQQVPLDRDALVSALDRQEVRRQLMARGVDPDRARERIAALSDEQVAQLQAHMDQLPAGSGVVGILVAVLLVLVILDIIGVTNIFTFIHPPSR